jgi:hypothetical protein
MSEAEFWSNPDRHAPHRFVGLRGSSSHGLKHMLHFRKYVNCDLDARGLGFLFKA